MQEVKWLLEHTGPQPDLHHATCLTRLQPAQASYKAARTMAMSKQVKTFQRDRCLVEPFLTAAADEYVSYVWHEDDHSD